MNDDEAMGTYFGDCWKLVMIRGDWVVMSLPYQWLKSDHRPEDPPWLKKNTNWLYLTRKMSE